MVRKLLGLAAFAAICGVACDSGSKDTTPTTKVGDNEVFFSGYVYDGATGSRLTKDQITGVSIVYGDKTIDFDIADDGRFVSKTGLPTWRDYTVKIDATGYRAFASYNTGIDVPASLAMTNGVAQAATTQSLDFSAYLFPVALKSPKLTLTVTTPDPMTGAPVTDKVDGQARLRPQSVPSIFIGGSTPAKRVWANGEDLLTQTVTKSFTNGTVVVDEGELVYGVSYELTIFDVAGFQPLDVTGSNLGGTTTPIVAGFVTSQTFNLTPETQDPLRIISVDGATCVPPVPTATTYGGKVTLTFNSDIEVVGTTFAEDIDNGLAVQLPSSTTSSSYSICPLKTPTGDPAQERGSKVEVGTNTMTFSFNPSIGFSTTSPYGTCMLPPSIMTIVYYQGNTTIMLQPKGDSLRKRSLSSMLNEKLLTSQLTCPTRVNSF
jgi:hypothetical protein